MPVNYLGLKSQIIAMGEDTQSRQPDLQARLARCQVLLHDSDTDLINLQRVVEEAAAGNKGLRCAVPVDEPLTTHLPCKRKSPACTVFAADGSQVNPDPHDSVLYGLVNIGIFAMHLGSGQAPVETVDSHLIYGGELQTADGLVSEDLVALLRDVREREMLAEISRDEPAPVLTLTDGPLELFHQPQNEKQFRAFFDAYLRALDDLAIANIITAGYISRPRARLVVNMLALLDANAAVVSPGDPFAGVTDIALYHDLLAPGERSAIFRLQSSASRDYNGRKTLHFFYLNVGTPNHPAFARVEIPLWVVEDPTAVEVLHAVLVEQSLQAGNNPYPYPLLRAHEIAVVKMPDKEQLTTLIQVELLRRGFPMDFKSEKQFNKELSGKKRLL